MATKKTKRKITLLITFFTGVTFAYFMWLVWNKLTEVIGDSNKVLIITGVILVVLWILGFFSFKRITEEFM